MKIISWNVNGLRAAIKKGFNEFVKEQKPDVLCLQEIKCEKLDVLPDYYSYWNSALKKGYSGTAIFTKIKPLTVDYDIPGHDKEGRSITLEFDEFYLVNVYVPNSQHELKRLEYRMKWDKDLRDYLKNLDSKKQVVLCGDLNVAHKEIDLANPSTNTKNPGFTMEEREGLTKLLNEGFKDAFREFNKEAGQYSWWSYRFNARERNIGWRIDYFVTSNRAKLIASEILKDVTGSDHCPVTLEL